MNGLNDKQNEACSYTEGPLLILAGAGSGKTRVITHRIAHLIDDCDVNPYNILAITFTNKAANEMRERVDKLVGFGSESIWVSTFHSMCVRILRRFNERLGGSNHFTIYDTDDQKSVMKEVLRVLNVDNKQFPEKGCLAVISKAKEEFRTSEDMEAAAGTSYRDMQYAKIYKAYQERLRSNNAYDFDDLIFYTIKLFNENPDVLEAYQKRFKYIMVDEYQDTNHSQFLLVKLLAGMYRNLCVVGDDDQSIYKFRGANIYNILNFEEEYPDAKVVRLEQNYRSTSNILNAANAVIANNKGRKEKTLWTENEAGDCIQYTVYDTEYEEALGTVNEILRLSNSGVRIGDTAILYRTNAQSRVLEEKLVFSNVPYKLVGGTGFYNRREIRDIVAYLKLTANPDDDVSFARIVNVPRRGIGDTTVEKLRGAAFAHGQSMYDFCRYEDHASELGRSGGKLIDFVKLMESFRDMAAGPDADLVGLYDEILSRTGYVELLNAEGTDEAKARIENLKELKNKIADYERSNDEVSLLGLLEEISLVADTDDGEEEDDNKVTLMTLHSAKGLEFPYVFMVGMEEGLFPSSMSMNSDDPDAVEEERRLCYVGITRAMKKLYMSSATSRTHNGTRVFYSQSRFVKEIPGEYIKTTGQKRAPGSYGGTSHGGASGSYGRTTASGYKAASGYGSRSKFGAGASLGSYGKSTSGINKADIDYAVGDTVKHMKFGKGKVVNITSMGQDYTVTVNFDSVGEKKLFASLAKLKKV